MKRSYIILVLAVIVAAVVWLVERPYRTEVGDFIAFKLYPALNENDVAKIEVEHLINGVTLTKIGDEWKVAEFETEMGREAKKGESGSAPSTVELNADVEKVKSVIDKLAALEAHSLVSTNPEKQATYQVNKIAKQVRLYDGAGKLLVNLYVGKEGTDVFSSYARREGEDKVYLVDRQIDTIMPEDILGWTVAREGE